MKNHTSLRFNYSIFDLQKRLVYETWILHLMYCYHTVPSHHSKKGASSMSFEIMKLIIQIDQNKTSHLQKVKGEHKINIRTVQTYMQNLRKAEVQNELSLTKSDSLFRY